MWSKNVAINEHEKTVTKDKRRDPYFFPLKTIENSKNSSNRNATFQVGEQKPIMVRCVLEVGNSQMKRYISAEARENSKHVKPKLLWMDFFESKCFQYGVNHCKTTFISCLCLSKEGWDTKLSRLVCSVLCRMVYRGRCAHRRRGNGHKQLVVTLME